MNISKKTQEMVLTAIFSAIIIAMANIPYLGYLNLGVISATLIHIPVIGLRQKIPQKPDSKKFYQSRDTWRN